MNPDAFAKQASEALMDILDMTNAWEEFVNSTTPIEHASVTPEVWDMIKKAMSSSVCLTDFIKACIAEGASMMDNEDLLSIMSKKHDPQQ